MKPNSHSITAKALERRGRPITLNKNTKCPTTKGIRAASNKPAPPSLTQEILFAKTLRKIAARQKTFPAKSDKQLSYALLKSRFDYEEHMFCLTEALQKAAAAVQEIGVIYAILEERQRKNGGEDLAPWFPAYEKAFLLEVAGKFPSATMLGKLTFGGLCDVAGILPNAPSTDSGHSPLMQSMKNAHSTTTA